MSKIKKVNNNNNQIMNNFGFIDYKRPLGNQYDFRTSSYIGHKHMTDTMLGNKLNIKFPEKKSFVMDPLLDKQRVTEHRASYTAQPFDPNELRNPSLGGKINFMKPFVEQKLKFLKRPMRPACSVSKQDFKWHRIIPPEPLPQKLMPKAIRTTPIPIDRSKPGYGKYLDPSATTYRLAFVEFPLKDMQATKNTITFWNWNEHNFEPLAVTPIKATMCDYKSQKECPKRNEFSRAFKRVPHSGMTTEVRQNYKPPILRTQDIPRKVIRNHLGSLPIEPSQKLTEAKIYGSGDRTEKYV